MRKERKQGAQIAEAKRRMLAAAVHYNRGLASARAELRAAMKALESHPDYARTVAARRRGERGRGAYSLAHWLHGWIKDAEEGVDVGSYGTDLMRDARGRAERAMKDAIADDEAVPVRRVVRAEKPASAAAVKAAVLLKAVDAARAGVHEVAQALGVSLSPKRARSQVATRRRLFGGAAVERL
jgi:hypothetical protein